MKTYPQQHEPWDPSYPPVWQYPVCGETHDCNKVDLLPIEIDENIIAFATARRYIYEAMKS